MCVSVQDIMEKCFPPDQGSSARLLNRTHHMQISSMQMYRKCKSLHSMYLQKIHCKLQSMPAL